MCHACCNNNSNGRCYSSSSKQIWSVSVDKLQALNQHVGPVPRATGIVDSPPIPEWECLLSRIQHPELAIFLGELPRCPSALIARLRPFVYPHIPRILRPRATRIPTTSQPLKTLVLAWTTCSTTNSTRPSSPRTVADQTSSPPPPPHLTSRLSWSTGLLQTR